MANWKKVIVSGSAAELSSLLLTTALPATSGGTGLTSITSLLNSSLDISGIATNATNIATNVTAISGNDTDIATNATNIATNVTNIGSNDTDIATNVTNIATNATNIGTNDTDIATNATNIATNVTDITATETATATNATNIATNVTNISSNDTDIATNVTNINLKANIASPTFTGTIAIPNFSNVETTLGGIATNASGVSTNSDNISLNDTDIATNVTNIATNVTNIGTNATNIALKANIASPTFTGTVSMANLHVTGTTTTVDTETITLADNFINMNSNLGSSTAPTEDAGISINRGSADNANFFFDEATKRWAVSLADLGSANVSTHNAHVGMIQEVSGIPSAAPLYGTVAAPGKGTIVIDTTNHEAYIYV